VRLLVTGAAGLLGGRLAQILAARFEVVAGCRDNPPPPGLPTAHLDLASPGGLGTVLETVAPEAVLHAAAIADPDRCEADPEGAFLVNTEATARLAAWCAGRGIPLVALSTDLVFGGDRAPYREDNPPDPISVYGRTKAAAEKAALEHHPRAAVARIALVAGCGHGARRTASEAVAQALVAARPARLYTDQVRTPIDDRSVADGVTKILERGLSGIFHLGGGERLSRFELGCRVASTLALPESLLVAVRSGEQPQKAPRPRDVSLDSSKTAARLGWSPRPLGEALRESRLA
jgi:dTDP-4-dehydrorhamnose reductase